MDRSTRTSGRAARRAGEARPRGRPWGVVAFELGVVVVSLALGAILPLRGGESGARVAGILAGAVALAFVVVAVPRAAAAPTWLVLLLAGGAVGSVLVDAEQPWFEGWVFSSIGAALLATVLRDVVVARRTRALSP